VPTQPEVFDRFSDPATSEEHKIYVKNPTIFTSTEAEKNGLTIANYQIRK